MDDINKAIEENTPLVYYIIRKYFSTFIHDDDIIQSGLIGLWKSLINFDSTKNIKFATFATKVIMNDINMEIRKRRKSRLDISMYTSVSGTSDDNDLEIYDSISDNLSGVHDYSTYELEQCLRSDEFTEKERTVLVYKYRGYTQKKIGAKMGISQPQISRIEKSLRTKFKKLYGEEINI